MREFTAKMRGILFTITCRLFRKNISIGQGLRIYKKPSFTGIGKVHIGQNCLIDGIRGDTSQYVTIDTLNSDAVITIGDNACLYAARISSRFSITIGTNVHIEETGIADTDFHSIDRTRGIPGDETMERCAVVIGNFVSIGAKSFVTKGVMIGDMVLVGPGSIVASSVKANSYVLGNPAKEYTKK